MEGLRVLCGIVCGCGWFLTRVSTSSAAHDDHWHETTDSSYWISL